MARMRACASPAKIDAALRLEPGEEGGIAEKAVFRDFGIACREFAAGQRVEKGDVGKDGARLVERADEILAVRRIDAGLAADRGIDLGQQRRRNLDEVDAAAQDRCGKAGEIADDAATQAMIISRRSMPAASRPSHSIGEMRDSSWSPRPPARRLSVDSIPAAARLARKRFKVKLRDIAVGDDGGDRASEERLEARSASA